MKLNRNYYTMNRIFKFSVLSLFFVVFAVLFQGCKEEIIVSINGTATISKNPVKNGDDVYLSIGKISFDKDGNVIVDLDYHTVINGKEYGIPRVRYFIDDKEVGTSNSRKENYACKYHVAGLQVGEHVLRAEAEPQEDETTFTGEYQSMVFTVEAEE